MKNEASDFHPQIVEEFRQGTWYEPRDSVGQEHPISGLLLSVYGAVLFAAVIVALLGIVGGGAVLISVFAAMLFAAVTLALVGIVSNSSPPSASSRPPGGVTSL